MAHTIVPYNYIYVYIYIYTCIHTHTYTQHPSTDACLRACAPTHLSGGTLLTAYCAQLNVQFYIRSCNTPYMVIIVDSYCLHYIFATQTTHKTLRMFTRELTLCMCICAYVCLFVNSMSRSKSASHKATHTYIHTYIHIMMAYIIHDSMSLRKQPQV